MPSDAMGDPWPSHGTLLTWPVAAPILMRVNDGWRAREAREGLGGPEAIRGWRRLPGYELVAAGLADLEAGRLSEAALLVALAGPRLRALGLALPNAPAAGDAKGRLWDRLAETEGDAAHGRFNALVQRILAFADAADGLRTSGGRG